MLFLQILGYVAFSSASLVLGTKLFLLWRRSREIPELSLGLSFLLGGGIAYLAWLALVVAADRGAQPITVIPIVLAGLTATCVGAIANGIGIARIFRPEAGWTRPFLGAVALFMVAASVTMVVSPPERASQAFWAGLLAIIPIYGWSSFEAFALARTLHRRAKIGLADVVVVHRLFQWGVSGVLVVAMTSLSFVSRLLHGPVMPPAIGALNAAFGVASALVIWLGFFPPQALRARLARAYATAP